MMKKAVVSLLVLGVIGPVSAYGRGFLARFDGGVGVIPASSGAGTVNPDGTFPNVKLNVVREFSRRDPGESPISRPMSTRTANQAQRHGLLLASGIASGRTPTRASSRP